jgi:glycosyltransferase involved in cell wall biosynthesis
MAAKPVSTPSVSVVMAVHNGERWLAETLASLSAQTFGDFEVVVIDDGSTDGSAAILAEAAARDARYRVITQANFGLVASLNRGLAEARAPLVARIDADDVAEPERFARQVAFLSARPEVAAVGSAIRIIDGDGRFLRMQTYPCGPEAVAKAMLRGCALAHPAVMMRRAAVQTIGGYREAFRHAEDYDLWLRLGESHALDNLPEPLLRYRRHGGSVSFRHRQHQALASFVARCCARERRDGRPDPLRDLCGPMDRGILPHLGLRPADEAAFWFDSAKAALWPAGQDNDADQLEADMEQAWRLREHLSPGRFVRRCLMPHAHDCARHGRADSAALWKQRAFSHAPLSATWSWLTGAFR